MLPSLRTLNDCSVALFQAVTALLFEAQIVIVWETYLDFYFSKQVLNCFACSRRKWNGLIKNFRKTVSFERCTRGLPVIYLHQAENFAGYFFLAISSSQSKKVFATVVKVQLHMTSLFSIWYPTTPAFRRMLLRIVDSCFLQWKCLGSPSTQHCVSHSTAASSKTTQSSSRKYVIYSRGEGLVMQSSTTGWSMKVRISSTSQTSTSTVEAPTVQLAVWILLFYLALPSRVENTKHSRASNSKKPFLCNGKVLQTALVHICTEPQWRTVPYSLLWLCSYFSDFK